MDCSSRASIRVYEQTSKRGTTEGKHEAPVNERLPRGNIRAASKRVFLQERVNECSRGVRSRMVVMYEYAGVYTEIVAAEDEAEKL